MIAANELRIGNWLFGYDPRIMVNNEKTFFKVESIEEDGINIWRVEYFSDESASGESITLTNDILVKCGFKYNKVEGIASMEESNREGDTYYWEKGVRDNTIADHFNFCIVKWGENGSFNFSSHFLRVKLKSVHQLQNLYYALTGEELIINF